MDPEFLPCGKVDSHNVILSRAPKIQIEHDASSTLLEQGRHGIGAVAERRVSGIIEDEEVEGSTLTFGEISAQPPRPQDAKFELVIGPGGDKDILGCPDRLCGRKEHERSDDNLHDRDCDEDVDAFQRVASGSSSRLVIEDWSRPRHSRWPFRWTDETAGLRSWGRYAHCPRTGETNPLPFLWSNISLPLRRLLGSARNDDRDIVRPAAFVRECDQNVAGGLGIARFDHDPLNLIIFHMVDEAVATQQNAVATLHREASDIRSHLVVDPEGHRDHVLPGMVPGVVRGKLPPVDHLLNKGVVPRHLVNLPRVDDVRPGVTGVRDMKDAPIATCMPQV